MNTENTEQRLKITEMFFSIQGETSRTGLPTTFIRLTGCPLRCNYCDTTYSFTGGQWKSLEEIINYCKQNKSKWVCITGGEPLAQKNCLALTIRLKREGFDVSIETSGEKNIRDYKTSAKIIMDIKTPSSGEKAIEAFENLQYLDSNDEVKFVIGSEHDYSWSKDICYKYNLFTKAHVLFSPVHGKFDLKEMAEKILSDQIPVRLQTQMHKYIWGSETKGV